MFETILLVDDNSDYREILKREFSEYNILEADDGKTTLEILKKPNNIDLVLLDIHLPDIEGTVVLNEIKRIEPSVGVFVLSGDTSSDLLIKCLRGHADDFICKTDGIKKLRSAMRRVLCQKKTENGPSTQEKCEKVEKVKRYVQKHCLRNVGLKEASELVCLSPKYLSRVFRAECGKGFGRYKLALKIEYAEGLLVKTGYTVYQVADKIGYENPESFIRQFKKLKGITPTQYRGQAKKKNGKKRAVLKT